MPDSLTKLLVARQVPKLTAEEQVLRDKWNAPKLAKQDPKWFRFQDDPLPIPLPPAGFLSPPNVVPSLQQAYSRLEKIAPNLGQKVKEIRHHVNPSFEDDLVRYGFNANDYERLNTLGTADTSDTGTKITINPGLSTFKEIIPTMGHELTHVVDPRGDHKEAYDIGNLIRTMLRNGWK